MKIHRNSIAALVVMAGLVSSGMYVSAQTAAPAVKKSTRHAAPKPKPVPAATAAELDELKRELQGQINSLKQELSDRDAKLKQAQDAAATAQAAASRAEAAASAQQQATADNATAVTTLQSTVTDLKTNEVNLVTTITDGQAAIKKSMDSPDTLHYKGINITPGGFMAAETVYRTHATGGDIPTAFSGLPYEHADAYHLGEFYGSARQSRVSMLAEGKTPWGKARGYVEADFLGTGITSNNNQSNSYVMRERVVWGEAELNSGWKFSGGQMWSLATEMKKGIGTASSDALTPQTIDPNYVPGFVWTRQYGFRVVKSYPKMAFGIAAENAQLLYSATLAGNTPYAVLGSAGANGGNYNAAVSGCSLTTQNVVSIGTVYTTDPVTGAVTGGPGIVKTPTYLNVCSNIANYSFNAAPDLIVKAAFDPGFGHYEILGIGRYARETIFPGVTTNAYLYGGIPLAQGGKFAGVTSAGAYNNNIALGGVGLSGRIGILKNKITLGAKGLYGSGVGRYGDTGLSDLTNKANGEFAALTNASALGTFEFNITPRLLVWFDFGGDYVQRQAATGATITKATLVTTGALADKAVALTVAPGAVGYGSRLASNAGCLKDGSPAYNSGTGFLPAGSCGAATHYVEEYTGGYWYDLYRGPAGRLRQSIQYGYSIRQSWQDQAGVRARGLDNMIWTSFRYYLP